MLLDIGAHSLTDEVGRDLQLTPAEFKLLAALVRGAGRALSRDHLMQAIAGRDTEPFDRSVDVLIGRLRRKVEPDPRTRRLIVTVPGVGYKFTERPALGGTPAMLPQSTAAREPDRPSIAVLPFANLSGDPDQDYFADGMVEEITTALSRVRWFFVIARNSSFTYKGRAVDVKQVGRELGVRYVLEGSVRKAGDRVRITVQLVETETGAHVWADRFDGVVDDIFDLQDEIATSVVGAIEPQLRDAELNRARGRRPTNPTAYDCFLRGMAKCFAKSRGENDETMRLLQRAIASDPEFAPAYALASACCIYRSGNGWSEDCPSRSATRRGTGEDRGAAGRRRRRRAGARWPFPRLPGRGVPDLSLSLTERALVLNPSSATALQFGGWARLHAGDPDQAMMHFLRGTRLNPIDTKRFILDSGLAYACLMRGHAAEAVSWAHKSLAGAPHWIIAALPLAGALALLGRVEEARVAFAPLLERVPSHTISREVRWFKPGNARDAFAAALTKAGFPP